MHYLVMAYNDWANGVVKVDSFDNEEDAVSMVNEINNHSSCPSKHDAYVAYDEEKVPNWWSVVSML